MSNSLQPHGLQHPRLLCPSPWVCSNSCPLSWWCYLTIPSSATPFFCPQFFPASRSFQMSPLFASGGQSIGVSASTSVLPMNTQYWSCPTLSDPMDCSPPGSSSHRILQASVLECVASAFSIQGYDYILNVESSCNQKQSWAKVDTILFGVVIQLPKPQAFPP